MPNNLNEIIVDSLPFYSWNYEDQTEAKHRILKEYINCWIKILGKYNKLNYFDCYGGCGSYTETGNDLYFGSPIEVAKIIDANHEKLGRQVKIIIIEKDKKVLSNLQKVIKYSQIKTKPILINDDFDSRINQLIDNDQVNAPSFFFIDPFGYSLKIKTIKKLMNIDKSEAFINFMYNDINRFIGRYGQEHVMNNLFGCGDWQKARSLSGTSREAFIVDLFIRQVKTFSKYAYPYRINFPNQNRTYYYLIHLSNNLKGSAIMKSAFCKLNLGRVEYLGHLGNNLTIFDMTQFKIDDIISYFNDDYWRNKNLSFDQIIHNTIDSTPYTESNIRDALKSMEKSGVIKIERIDSKKTGIKGNDIISFVENKNGNL